MTTRPSRRSSLVLAACVAGALAGAGCASVGRAVFEQPVVTFRDLKINGLGLQGGSLDVVLNVYNPNRYALNATRLTYRLMVDSVPLGTGALDQRFVVQRGDSSTVRLPVTFTYSGLGSVGRQLLRSGTVNYRVIGDVTVGTPLGNFTRPFDRTGHFSSFGGAR
jgi:LEA14-like dessication related protein